MKKEIAEREAKEAERLARDNALVVAPNGTCRYVKEYQHKIVTNSD